MNYQSCSLSPTIPMPYADAAFKRIKIPAGTRLMYMQNMSYYPILEVVLPEKSKYVITKSRDVVFYINAVNHQKDIHDKYKMCTPMKALRYMDVELLAGEV